MKEVQMTLKAISTNHPVSAATTTKNAVDEQPMLLKTNSAPQSASKIPAIPVKKQIKFNLDQQQEEAEKALSTVRSVVS